MFKSIALILLVLGLTQASLVPVGDLLKSRQELLAEDDLRIYVDQVMAQLRKGIVENHLNNIPLPDATLKFSETILGVTYYGEASLTNGFLKGLETIHRTGDAMGSKDPNGDLVIRLEIGVNHGTLGYMGTVKFMNQGPSISLAGSLKSVRVLIVLRLGDGLHPSLDTLDIIHLGTLNVDINGLGVILNFLGELLANFVGNLVKDTVAEALQGPVKTLLNGVLSSIIPPPTSQLFIDADPANVNYAIPYIR